MLTFSYISTGRTSNSTSYFHYFDDSTWADFNDLQFRPEFTDSVNYSDAIISACGGYIFVTFIYFLN